MNENARYQIMHNAVQGSVAARPGPKKSNNLERSTLKSTSSATTTEEPLINDEEPEYEYYYEYIYEDDLPEFTEMLPPSTTFETTLPTKQTYAEPPLTASNGN